MCCENKTWGACALFIFNLGLVVYSGVLIRKSEEISLRVNFILRLLNYYFGIIPVLLYILGIFICIIAVLACLILIWWCFKRRDHENQPLGNQCLENQPHGNQCLGNQCLENQPLGNQPLGNQPLENQPLGNQPLGNQPLENQPLENQPLGNQPLGNQPLGNQSLGNQCLENQSLENQCSENWRLEKQCLLQAYMIVLAISLVIVLIIGTISIAHQDGLKNELQDMLQEAYQNYTQDTQHWQFIDSLHEELKCCGTHNYTFFTNSSYPLSCCGENVQTFCTEDNIYTTGCTQALFDFMYSEAFTVLWLSLGTCGMLILPIIAACYLKKTCSSTCSSTSERRSSDLQETSRATNGKVNETKV